MKHIALSPNCDYEPVPIVAVERRCRPSRRDTWRGGRRDADWINRPLGVLQPPARRAVRGSAWPRALFARWIQLRPPFGQLAR